MRLVYVIAVLACTAVAVKAGEFQVTNNVPAAFTVVNRADCSCGASCDCPPGACPSCTVPVLYDPEHTCSRCGTYANVVKDQANGQHSHQCPRCGNTWWHADPGAVAVPAQYVAAPANPFAVGDCPDGNCPWVRGARVSGGTVSVAPVASSGGVVRGRLFPLFPNRPRLFTGRLLGRVFGGGCCR